MATVQEVKEFVRYRDGHKCTLCGITAAEHVEKYGRNLDVHRTVPGSEYTVEGCITVCRRCHGPLARRPWGSYLSGQYNISIPIELYEEVRRFAKANERSIVWVVRKALQEYLERHANDFPKEP